MAYSTSAPPQLLTQAIAGLRIWYQESADATAAADAAGFITNGQDLGMKVGDIVYHKDSTTDATALTSHKVIALSAVNRSVDLSDGTVIGSATNTD